MEGLNKIPQVQLLTVILKTEIGSKMEKVPGLLYIGGGNPIVPDLK